MGDRPTTAVVKLLFPVTVASAKYEELTLRRMKARDTLIGEDETNKVMAGYKMFATLAGVDVEVILELDVEDLTRVGEAAAPLMGKQLAAEFAKGMKKIASSGET